MTRTHGDAAIDVLGVGCIAVDILMRTPRLPREGDKVFASGATLQGGGLIATALVAVSRLGGRARLLGCLGTSRFAQQALEDLREEGVDVSGIARKAGAEPVVAVVLVDEQTGQRTIVASFEGVEYPVGEALPLDDLARARCVLVDQLGGEASVALARAARSRRLPVVVDLEGVNEWTDNLVALATDVVVGEEFARSYTGAEDRREALTHLWGAGGRNSVVITRGGDGADYVTADGMFHQPAFRVSVVDTTGCGDVFHGAFALARARGWTVRETVRYAAAVAALKARRLGGRAGIPTGEEVDAFLAHEGR